MDKEKERKIKREISKLRKIYKNISEDKMKLCENLIKNAAFMSATLEELQDIINKDGAVIDSKNGNGFEVTQEHPAQKSYNQMVSKYSGVIRQLCELLPDSKTESVMKAGDTLTAFIKAGKGGRN